MDSQELLKQTEDRTIGFGRVVEPILALVDYQSSISKFYLSSSNIICINSRLFIGKMSMIIFALPGG